MAKTAENNAIIYGDRGQAVRVGARVLTPEEAERIRAQERLSEYQEQQAGRRFGASSTAEGIESNE